MLILDFPAAAFATNCYVVAPQAGAECVVVDPGVDVIGQLDALLDRHRLKPVAVLLTHGHLDHTFSVTPVCGARDVPAYVHPDDAGLLADPMAGFPGYADLFGGRLQWSEPEDVKPLVDCDVLRLAGLELRVDHAPGHTPGSVLFRLPGGTGGSEDAAETCLSGDVLFAGSIGRTDLPGGDHARMLHTLATKILPLPDETTVLPGHGPRTTVRRERATNPFLQHLPASAPRRGL